MRENKKYNLQIDYAGSDFVFLFHSSPHFVHRPSAFFCLGGRTKAACRQRPSFTTTGAAVLVQFLAFALVLAVVRVRFGLHGLCLRVLLLPADRLMSRFGVNVGIYGGGRIRRRMRIFQVAKVLGLQALLDE